MTFRFLNFRYKLSDCVSWFSVFSMLLFAGGCVTNQPVEVSSKVSPCCVKSVAAKTTNEVVSKAPVGPMFKLADVGSNWQDDHGKWHNLSDLNGKILLASMFFTSCQGICVLTLEDMQKVEASLSPGVRSKVRFVMVSLDPERDGAKQLHNYRKDSALAEDRWNLLRGDKSSTSRMAKFLGIGYGRDDSGRFVHGETLAILDGEGRVITRLEGPHPNLKTIVTAINTAVSSGQNQVASTVVD